MPKQKTCGAAGSIVAWGAFCALVACSMPHGSALCAQVSSVPAGLQIATFATGLNYPYGMYVLADGSLLVATSNPATGSLFGPTTLQIYRYTTTNGVADTPTLVLDSGLPGPATGMAGVGNLVAVATGRNTGSQILILQAGADGSLAQLGAISFTYPLGTWAHDSHTVALRTEPGQTGVYQLLFGVGSQAGSVATPLPIEVAASGLISQNLQADSLYSLQFTVTGTMVSAGAAVQLAKGLGNPFALSFAANGYVWTATPAAPLTLTVSGSTATIAVAGQTASGSIPASLLTSTQLGFYAPFSGFVVSSLVVSATSQATPTSTTLAPPIPHPRPVPA